MEPVEGGENLCTRIIISRLLPLFGSPTRVLCSTLNESVVLNVPVRTPLALSWLRPAHVYLGHRDQLLEGGG